LQRLFFGITVTSSFRFIGTPYEVPYVPPPGAITRKQFLRRTWAVI
jgi:hypothetical protein